MKHTYKALVGADVYRDGGSIEVRFVCTDGSSETIWLQVADTPDGIFVHTDLLIYSNAERHGPALRIAKASPEEDALVAALHRFLSHPKVDVPFVRRTEDGKYIETVETLIASISKRVAND